jgi:hypothetical protein
LLIGEWIAEREKLWNELEAFQVFIKTGDWGLIEDARKAGYKKAIEYTERLLSVYNNHKSEEDLIAKFLEDELHECWLKAPTFSRR